MNDHGSNIKYHLAKNGRFVVINKIGFGLK